MRLNMAFSRVSIRVLLRFNVVVLLACLVGCASLNKFAEIDNNTCETPFAVAGAANVSVFLNIAHQGAASNVSLKISSIELLVDDLWVPFTSSVAEVNTGNAISHQKFLGRQWLKGQFCRGIRLKVAIAKLSHSGAGDASLTVSPSDSEIILQNPLALEPDSRKVLFLEWNPAKSIERPEPNAAAFSAYSGGTSRISSNLLFVTCPDIDTVYVVGADKFQVVDAFAVNGRPSYLAVDSANKRTYVLAESQNKIMPYDIPTHFPGSEIVVSLANSPNFMVVKNTSKIAYVLDAQGVLTSIDLVSGNMINRNRIGNGPNYISYLDNYNKLAVSSTYDHTVYLVNPDSLAVEDSIVLNAAPLGLLGWKNYLYIAQGVTSSVSIYDLNSRRFLKSIHVGFGPSRFVATSNSVYVANYGDGTISIMQGEQFGVSKEVTIGKHVREMAVAEKQRLLFVGEGDCDGSLVVLDTTANQVVGRVELGARPLGLAVNE